MSTSIVDMMPMMIGGMVAVIIGAVMVTRGVTVMSTTAIVGVPGRTTGSLAMIA